MSKFITATEIDRRMRNLPPLHDPLIEYMILELARICRKAEERRRDAAEDFDD